MSGFRRYGRKPLRYAVKFTHSSAGDIQAETQDISETGMFVRGTSLAKCLTIGDTLNAQLRCDQDSVENTQLKVVRMTDDGVGLAFE